MNDADRIPVRLHYLGDRAYIDISTIDSCFLRAMEIEPEDLRVGAWKIRVFRPIRNHGILVRNSRGRNSCQFEFEFNRQQQFSYSFVESSEVIVERQPELRYLPSQHFDIEGRRGRFIRPITGVRTYNFMALGKALVLHNTEMIPRVVRSQAWASISIDEYPDVDMSFTELRNSFAVLRTNLKGQKLGEIVVKLLDPRVAAKSAQSGF